MQRDEEPEAIVDNGDDFYCESDIVKMKDEDERVVWPIIINMKASLIFSKTFRVIIVEYEQWVHNIE